MVYRVTLTSLRAAARASVACNRQTQSVLLKVRLVVSFACRSDWEGLCGIDSVIPWSRYCLEEVGGV